MKIGELASKTATRVETIRYYEQEGLLPEPDRNRSNYRQYNETHLERLRFISNCRSLDMSHVEIKELLRFADEPSANCSRVNEIVDHHLEHVEQRIRDLSQLQAQLSELRGTCTCAKTVRECRILQGLGELKLSGGVKKSHL